MVIDRVGASLDSCGRATEVNDDVQGIILAVAEAEVVVGILVACTHVVDLDGSVLHQIVVGVVEEEHAAVEPVLTIFLGEGEGKV